MKVSLNIEADAINVLALNMGRIAVDIDGITLSELIAALNQNGSTLRIADEPGEVIIESPLAPFTSLPGLCCSTAHITDDDNSRLYHASHQQEDYGNSEWIHFTGTGYLIRLNAWQYPVLRLKQLGLSKDCRRLIITLMRQHHITLLHLDAAGNILPEFATFDW
ncbi:MAG: DUF5983 family protein [Serratia proteamaculans]|nr:DUF5983 family protein [Serratia marcescens]MBS3894752.1 hypothetical protein [Serratia marcescens]HBC7422237.1 hypothetical protein [Serratia marcescens]